jgi:chaperonin cofactor prefoldin
MKKFRELTKNMYEEKKDKYDEGEYDQEGDMAKSDLRSIIANAQKMHDMIDDADNLPEWVQSKITKAEDYISTVANYMTSEMSEETKLEESGGPVLYKKGDDHIEKYGEDSFALYKDGKKAKYYTSLEAAKEAMNEEVEELDEKNVPTSPEKWAQAKSQAKAKFDVYPSAYANGWAAKKYKEMGGGWKSVSEETKPPFEGPYTKVTGTVTDKSGAKHTPMSRVRDIARMAMKKQVEKMKKPVKEEASMKAKIVKDVMKKKKEKVTDDSFQKDPIISNSQVKM